MMLHDLTLVIEKLIIILARLCNRIILRQVILDVVLDHLITSLQKSSQRQTANDTKSVSNRVIFSIFHCPLCRYTETLLIESRNLILSESFEQISMYIEYGTPSCVSGGYPGGGVCQVAFYIKEGVGLFLGPNLDHCGTTNYDSRLTTTVNKTM